MEVRYNPEQWARDQIEKAAQTKATSLYLTELIHTITEVDRDDDSRSESYHYIPIGAEYLENIPQELFKLHGLKILCVSKNKISSVPLEIKELYDLEELDLSDNQITSLPAEIGVLKNLHVLSLANNKITSLPSDFKNLKMLKSLDLRGNPLSLPPEILEKTNDPKSILNYYFNIVSFKGKPLNQVKVILVGQGSVGKTSILRRLTENTFIPAENKTDGIEIRQWRDRRQKISINFWDFGGQEIMHATHQFFLSKRSLYLLVLDSRLTQEENRVEYWLKLIHSFGGESPVLIVGNKTDQHPLDIDRYGLTKKYPNITGIMETSAATGSGIKELEFAIFEQINQLKHVHDLLPKNWFTVKVLLEKMKNELNFVTYEKYIELCNKQYISEEGSQRNLIGLLHDLGVVLHFQDDPRLEALGILNPQWVTNGVYKILNSHELFQEQGKLTLSLLNKILDLLEYPRDKRIFIVDMMGRFELCYPIDSQSFLIPDLLPKDEPFTGEWAGALAFQYHYNVLPSSIISRFIVRMNAFIHKTAWRSGVVLKKAGNTALVKADTEDKKIYILVSGDDPTRRDFLSAIRAEFEAIHKTIVKIEATEKVPVPSHPEAEPVDYELLLQMERQGIEDYPVKSGTGMVVVKVREMLNGVLTEFDRRSRPEPPKPTVDSNKPATTPANNKPLLLKILTAIFVAFPRILGRAVLDIFGRGKDSADTTSILLGYVLIGVTVLVVWGILDLNSLRDWFTGWWRFFFPAK